MQTQDVRVEDNNRYKTENTRKQIVQITSKYAQKHHIKKSEKFIH